MAFRGHLIDRVSALFRWPPLGRVAAVLLSSVSFDLQHVYQGISGVLSTTLSGAMFASPYLLARRKLWFGFFYLASGVVAPNLATGAAYR